MGSLVTLVFVPQYLMRLFSLLLSRSSLSLVMSDLIVGH